ncbi:zinc finger protein ZFP2-like [Hetaerina americana]|uniref:zinc finger protein ZFP2-like n=1 Tax=Hetaerina americana TaxID=62018 RepID=UPI003A7F4F19
MCDKDKFEVCRLCLNSRGLLMNVFGENSKLQFMMEKTIEDLIDVKVVEDANYPWLVCSACMEKLTEFRLFKRRCAECLSVFYDRIREGCNPTATKEWIINGESLGRNRKEIGHDAFVSDNVDSTAAEVQDDMIHVKEEINSDGGRSCASEKDIDLPMVKSMQESDSQWNGNDEAGNYDPLRDGKLYLSFNEEVDTKEECDVDIPQMEGCLGVDLLQEQDNDQRPDTAMTQLHVCKICLEVFAQKDLLKDHLSHMHINKVLQFRCDVCSEVFEGKDDLSRHIKLVHVLEKKYQCNICLKNFNNQRPLKFHMSTHTGQWHFQCEFCLKGFAGKKLLQMHMSTHTGERPYRCNVCSKAFSQNGNLKRHMQTHSKEWEYMCPSGSKAFERRYHCSMCSKEFTRSDVLKNHMLTHTGKKPYKCQTCLKAFSQNGSLRRHMLTHTGERRHECHLCPEAYSCNAELKNHILRHTGLKT